MPVATQAPSFITRTADVVNSAGAVSISLPILNSGTAAANDLRITAIALGSAPLAGPVLPLPLGVLGVDNSIPVNAVFSAAALTPGSKYLMTVRGTYTLAGTTYGFTVNRYITIPQPVPPPMTFLAARLQAAVDTATGQWSYTVFNDEPAGSPRYVNALSIDMSAPFTVVGTPQGWAVLTDGFSYVLWYAVGQSGQLAPGASLSGFQVQSARNSSEGRAFTITSWNQTTNQADLVVFGTTPTPSHA